MDAGKNGHDLRIERILLQEGIGRIDFFVNTHYHEDHYGGIDDLILDPDITVATAYDRGDKAFLPQSKRDEDPYFMTLVDSIIIAIATQLLLFVL